MQELLSDEEKKFVLVGLIQPILLRFVFQF